MARYFFHLRDGDFHTPDEAGNDFDDLETAELAALTVIENLRAENPEWLAELISPHLEIVDETGTILSSLPFGAAEKSLN